MKESQKIACYQFVLLTVSNFAHFSAIVTSINLTQIISMFELRTFSLLLTNQQHLRPPNFICIFFTWKLLLSYEAMFVMITMLLYSQLISSQCRFGINSFSLRPAAIMCHARPARQAKVSLGSGSSGGGGGGGGGGRGRCQFGASGGDLYF